MLLLVVLSLLLSLLLRLSLSVMPEVPHLPQLPLFLFRCSVVRVVPSSVYRLKKRVSSQAVRTAPGRPQRSPSPSARADSAGASARAPTLGSSYSRGYTL